VSLSSVQEKKPVTHAFQDAVSFLLRSAKERQSSDVHLVPRGREGGGEVRFRIFGSLVPFRTFEDANTWDDLVKEFKRRAGLSFERGVAQDARFSDVSTLCDYRVSLIPVRVGDREAEQIVLRALPQDTSYSLDTLAIPADAKAALRHALESDQGLIILTGPTGSGKTSTLMSALMAVDRERFSVLTLEDPVEYALPGVTQTQVSAKLSFAQGLRAFLRQDPDYILVGETRDRETAGALLQAANTGHVVLTTLHTNSAADAFARLESLGVDPVLAREAVTFASAQRLAPKLCAACAVPDPEGQRLVEAMFGARPRGCARRSTGCLKCNGTGVTGRLLLFEYLAPTRNADGVRILTQASSLREQALHFFEQGVLHASELLALS
jgi:type II secretory ATPase GspE/PulE/Tfp pilus assembly ATPase PilB-like protein